MDRNREFNKHSEKFENVITLSLQIDISSQSKLQVREYEERKCKNVMSSEYVELLTPKIKDWIYAVIAKDSYYLPLQRRK